MSERPVELSNSDADLDRLSTAHSPRLLVTRIDMSSDEEEKMALNPRRGLNPGRKKALSKDVPQTQLPPAHPFPLLPSPFGLHLDPNLQKKKRKGKKIEEGEIISLKDLKQQKTARDRRGSFVKSKEDPLEAEVH